MTPTIQGAAHTYTPEAHARAIPRAQALTVHGHHARRLPYDLTVDDRLVARLDGGGVRQDCDVRVKLPARLRENTQSDLEHTQSALQIVRIVCMHVDLVGMVVLHCTKTAGGIPARCSEASAGVGLPCPALDTSPAASADTIQNRRRSPSSSDQATSRGPPTAGLARSSASTMPLRTALRFTFFSASAAVWPATTCTPGHKGMMRPAHPNYVHQLQKEAEHRTCSKAEARVSGIGNVPPAAGAPVSQAGACSGWT